MAVILLNKANELTLTKKMQQHHAIEFLSHCIIVMGAHCDSFGCPASSNRALGLMLGNNCLDMILNKDSHVVCKS